MSDTNLRGKLIRLAHEHPEFRKDILPLVQASDRKAVQLPVSPRVRGVVANIISSVEEMTDLASKYDSDPSDANFENLTEDVKYSRESIMDSLESLISIMKSVSQHHKAKPQ